MLSLEAYRILTTRQLGGCATAVVLALGDPNGPGMLTLQEIRDSAYLRPYGHRAVERVFAAHRGTEFIQFRSPPDPEYCLCCGIRYARLRGLCGSCRATDEGAALILPPLRDRTFWKLNPSA